MDREHIQSDRICPSCGKAIRLARTIPGIGKPPALRTYECKACAVVSTESVAGRVARELNPFLAANRFCRELLVSFAQASLEVEDVSYLCVDYNCDAIDLRRRQRNSVHGQSVSCAVIQRAILRARVLSSTRCSSHPARPFALKQASRLKTLRSGGCRWAIN